MRASKREDAPMDIRIIAAMFLLLGLVTALRIAMEN